MANRRVMRSLCMVAAMLLLSAFGAACLGDDQAAPAPDEGLLPVPDYSGDFWSRGYLTGDWGGARNELAGNGIQADVQWTQTGQSVVEGGRGTGTKYGGTLDYNITLDLMRMGLMPGALLKIRGESRYGESVNGLAGPFLPANVDAQAPLTDTADENVPITVTSVNYIQFLSEQLALTVGKFDTYDGDPTEFASGRGVTQFMNFNFVYNAAGALAPYSTLGGGVILMPNQQLTIASVVTNLADSSTTSGFDDFGDGWMWSTEANLQYQHGDLPGGMNLGSVFSFDGEFARLDKRFVFVPGQGLAAPTDDESWAVYWTGWQYLQVEDPVTGPVDLADGRPDHQGFGLFSRIGFADDETCPVEFTASIGLGGRGVISGRDDDMFGVGYYYISISDSRIGSILGFDDDSQGVEAFYNLAVAKSTSLSFDVQVLDAPAPDTDTSVVLGMRLNMRF